jgi:hypothetical protein
MQTLLGGYVRPIDYAHEIDGKRYFTIKNFAWVTMRSEVNVRFLISRGNRIRKIKIVRFGGKPFIPYKEMLEFPFTLPGRNNNEIYHYTERGEPVNAGVLIT